MPARAERRLVDEQQAVEQPGANHLLIVLFVAGRGGIELDRPVFEVYPQRGKVAVVAAERLAQRDEQRVEADRFPRLALESDKVGQPQALVLVGLPELLDALFARLELTEEPFQRDGGRPCRSRRGRRSGSGWGCSGHPLRRTGSV
jgi:hypothetical protein